MGKPLPPLTELQDVILAQLDNTERRSAHIARDLGLNPGSVQGALMALQRRGYAHHVGFGRGWVRIYE